MFYDIGKRIMDIFGAIVGLIIFSPILVGTAFFIKIVSPTGPIFAEGQKRVGKNGKEFRMFKFRSMIPNAQEHLKNNPELYAQYVANNYKLENDPRWLPGAAFMRKMSIDEMPQFFNILFGQMSVVGPRAYFRVELDEQIKKYPEAVEFVEQALITKPGLTGPWQIGGRSNVGFVERIKLDAGYAQKRSLLYDLLLILKTPKVVLTGKGAY